METNSASVLGAFARDVCAEDLLECLSINPGRIGDDLVGRARAIEIWKSLLSPSGISSLAIAPMALWASARAFFKLASSAPSSSM